MILLIDNYDSFAHNLARYLRLLGQQVIVVRNDLVTVDTISDVHARALVISPGPCSPNEAGNTLEVVAESMERLPILGICLGHQTIVQAMGGLILPSKFPMHGRTSPIVHDGKAEFAGQPNPLRVGRYHSLVACPSSLPVLLEVSAMADDGTIMAVRHRTRPIYGWQFHPESILTEAGFSLLASFLNLVGLSEPSVSHVNRFQAELRLVPPSVDIPRASRPLTF